MADLLAREDLDDTCLRDSISIASNDSFVSAAEVREAINFRLFVHLHVCVDTIRFSLIVSPKEFNKSRD